LRQEQRLAPDTAPGMPSTGLSGGAALTWQLTAAAATPQAPKSINAILKPLEILTQPLPPRSAAPAADGAARAGGPGAARGDAAPAGAARAGGDGRAGGPGDAGAGQARARRAHAQYGLPGAQVCSTCFSRVQPMSILGAAATLEASVGQAYGGSLEPMNRHLTLNCRDKCLNKS